MKTTIDIPEELLHRAKVAAAQRKTTLKELVLQGLDFATRHPPASVEADRRETMRRLVSGMQASNAEPMAPLKRAEIYDR